MRPDEFAAHFENGVRAAVRDAAQQAAHEIRHRTPPNFRRTRAAVFYRVDQGSAVVGLKFGAKYNAAGTPTQDRLLQQWLAIKPKLKRLIVRRINDLLKG